jgi:hypothetical protein
MKAQKVKPELDGPLLPGEKQRVEKPASVQMPLWPSLEDPQSEPETMPLNADTVDNSDADFFGETLLALAAIKGLGFRTLSKITALLNNHLERR